MESVASSIRRAGGFLRRRDLLALGHSDDHLRAALEAREIFRVRHGWYSLRDMSRAAIEAVRVGGRLTGIAALQSYGLRVPRRDYVSIAVVATACRLRSPDDRRRRLGKSATVRIHWIDRLRAGGNRWRVSIDEALEVVLATEDRFVAVACCSAVMNAKGWSEARMDRVFARSLKRVQVWRPLVSRLDDSHGETWTRLKFLAAGIPFQQQARLAGVGRLDFRVGSATYVEVDGAQHDPDWIDDESRSWEHDHARDETAAIGGSRVLRYTYQQLFYGWPGVLAAILRAIEDDALLAAARARHLSRRGVSRKRRTLPPQWTE